MKNRARNVRAVKQRPKPYANNNRTMRAGQLLKQVLRLNGLRGSPGIGGRLRGALRGTNLRLLRHSKLNTRDCSEGQTDCSKKPELHGGKRSHGSESHQEGL